MITLYQGEIYYWPKQRRFFQVREVHDDYLICGRMSEAYESAFTMHMTQNLSWEFLQQCKKVLGIDSLEGAVFNGYYWAVPLEAKDAPAND